METLDDMLNPKEVTFLFWTFVLTQVANLSTNIFSESIGNVVSLIFNLIVLILIIFVIIVHRYLKKRRKEKIESCFSSLIDTNILLKKYKGLIMFVSNPPFNKKNDEWFNECKLLIDSAVEKHIITEVSEIKGIGQTFKAINHHANELKYCWLIFSDQSGINVNIIQYFFEKVTKKSLKPILVKINDPNDSKHIKEKIDNIYNNLPEDIKVTDVISDITAGTKPMTAGMILSCLHSDRNMEYIEQSPKRNLIEVNISYKFGGMELC